MDDLALLRAIIEDLRAETGTIHWVGPDGMLHLAAVVGAFPSPVLEAIRVIPVGKGLAGLAAERRTCVTVCNLQSDASGQARPGARATGMEGAITAPCIAPDGTLAGVVGVANAGARTFTDAEQESLLAHGRRLAQVRAAARVADSGTELRHTP
jgi:putative methionine-R-sulfoxide reductase with GAF domain